MFIELLLCARTTMQGGWDTKKSKKEVVPAPYRLELTTTRKLGHYFYETSVKILFK